MRQRSGREATRICVALGLFCASINIAIADEPIGQTTGLSEKREQVFPPGSRLKICTKASEPADYIRLKMKTNVDPSADWDVTLSTPDNSWKTTIRAGSLSAGNWSVPIPGNCAMLTVPEDGVDVEVTRLLWPDTLAEPRNVFPEGDINSLKDPSESSNPKLRQLAEGTVMLRILDGDKEEACSGQLLAADLLITNNHCVKDETQANGAVIYFNYDGADLFEANSSTQPKILLTDWDLDVTFLELGKAVDVTDWYPSWRTSMPESGEALAITQHPSGDAILLSEDSDCHVVSRQRTGRAPNVDFGHRCDTSGGSSGSVVFSKIPICPHIVGLHHYGITSYTEDAQNQAVHGTKIREFLNLKSTAGTNAEKAAAVRILENISFESCDI